jgi:hypothetical protein
MLTHDTHLDRQVEIQSGVISRQHWCFHFDAKAGAIAERQAIRPGLLP